MACPTIENALRLSTDTNEAPKAFVAVPDISVSEPFSVSVQLCDTADANVSRILFDASMPAHQHGMNYTPNVTSLGGNIFTVENVVFHMPGIWQMDVEAIAPNLSTLYTLEIQVD